MRNKDLYISSLVLTRPVQVAGELSNAGQPMRRFMQTFVLAPQSPKKYYVYNDIFRYQDEVFQDGDSEPDGGEGAGDALGSILWGLGGLTLILVVCRGQTLFGVGRCAILLTLLDPRDSLRLTSL